MPLYEYECDACGRRFERIQKFSDPPVEACPTCGGAVHKLIASPAFQFKGTGWYITDYAKKDNGAGKAGTPEKEGKETSPTKDSATKEGAKSDGGSATSTSTESTPASAPAKPSSKD
jgi:putative FmdB family regulatory protein